MEYRKNGDRFGRHRVIEPKASMPQAATKLDNSLPIYDNEILIDVQTLNIDSASFRQMKDASNNDLESVAKQVLENVSKMGKQQNPVTGSGGMLLGTVLEIGPEYNNRFNLKKGDKVCTLVSLTLTPLIIDRIKEVKNSEQIDIEGKAVLFDSGVLAKVPEDVPMNIALALLDVAGAPAQAERLAKKGDVILIIGAGKSGVLCAGAIRNKLGKNCKIIVSSYPESSIESFSKLGLADGVFTGNALNAGEIFDSVSKITNGKMCDLVINTANIVGTEMASVLACKENGRVYFFNMATSFQKAALGAEGVGMDVEMIIGNGYAPKHAELTLDLYRENLAIKKWFDERFGGHK